MMRQRHQRRGTILIEAAVVYPVLVLLVLGLIVLGLAVFRYQQMAHIAREATRWAAVHGAQYASDTGNPAATPQDVYTNSIVPQAGGMDLSCLSYSVTWNTSNQQTTSTTVTDASGNSSIVTVANTVSVTVTYSWNMPLFGTIPVSSTSVMPMSY